MGNRLLFTTLFSIVITSCGGGNSSGGKGPAIDGSNISTEDFITQFKQLANDRYTGSRTLSENFDAAIMQWAYTLVGDHDATASVPISSDLFYTLEDITYANEPSSEFEHTFACSEGGQITASLVYQSVETYRFELLHENCHEFSNAPVSNGLMFLELYSNGNRAYFFSALELQTNEGSFTYTGVKNTILNSENSSSQYNTNIFILDNASGEQTLLEKTESIVWASDSAHTLEGLVYRSDIGRIDVITRQAISEGGFSREGELQVIAGNDRDAIISVLPDFGIQVAFDLDGNDEYTQGALFNDLDSLRSTEPENLQLAAIDALSFPPIVEQPFIFVEGNSFDTLIYTSDVLQVEPVFVSDVDTPIEDINVEYRWYINDVLVEGITGNALPAGTAIANDVVGVSAVAFDGVNEVESIPRTVTILDSPARLVIQNALLTAQYGEAVEFTATNIDPDTGEFIGVAEMAFGPIGAEISTTGVVSWMPEKTHELFNSNVYSFGFHTQDRIGNDIVQIVEILISGDAAGPIARASIGATQKSNTITMGRFTQENQNEVIVAGNGDTLSSLIYRDGEYVQHWMYPYALPTRGEIVTVANRQLDSDQQDELLIVSNAGLSVLMSSIDLMETFWETERFIKSAAISDSDESGNFQIAIVSSAGRYESSTNLMVLNVTPALSVTLLLEVALSENAVEVLYGNVDEDPNMEIVTNDGYVFDASTFETEWFYSDGFGETFLAVGDFNNDGIDEIAGTGVWEDVTVYSAVQASSLVVLANENFCSILGENVNQTAADELILGECGSPRVIAFDLSENTFNELWRVEGPTTEIYTLMIGNTDNDPDLELHWGSERLSTFSQPFSIANISETPSLQWPQNPVYFDYFHAAGWGDIEPGVERAVFVVPETNDTSGGQRIVTMDASGNIETSEEINEVYNGGFSARVSDYDNNGNADLFLSTAERFNEKFSLFELSTFNESWSSGASPETTILAVEAYDINSDTYSDAVFSDDDGIQVVDLYNQTLIAAFTVEENKTVRDIALPASMDQFSSPIIAAANDDNLSVWQQNGEQFARIAHIEGLRCDRINFANVDTDTDTELVCLDRTDYMVEPPMSTIIVFEVSDYGLTENSRSTFSGDAIEFVVDQSTSENQNILVARMFETPPPVENYSHISLMNPLTGGLLWTGPNILGLVNHRSMIHRNIEQGGEASRLMFATDKAMYLVK